MAGGKQINNQKAGGTSAMSTGEKEMDNYRLCKC